MKPLLDLFAVAQRLNVSVWHARRLEASGRLPSTRVGSAIRVDPDVLETWIRSGGNKLGHGIATIPEPMAGRGRR